MENLLNEVTACSYLYLKSSGAYFDFALKTTCKEESVIT